MCGGRPASRLNERWVVELVVLERERSRLVVRLVATAVELLLLRRRVGAWRWRIFLLGHDAGARWRCLLIDSRLRTPSMAGGAAANELIFFHRDRRRRAAVAAVAAGSLRRTCRCAGSLQEPRAEPQQNLRSRAQPQPSSSQPQASRSRAAVESQPSREACRSRDVMCVVAVTRVAYCFVSRKWPGEDERAAPCR